MCIKCEDTMTPVMHPLMTASSQTSLTLITRTDDQLRLQIHKDPRIPTIGIHATTHLSVVDRFKVQTGLWHRAKFLNLSGQTQEVFVSLKSLIKQTGLSPKEAKALLDTPHFLYRISQIADLIIKNATDTSIDPSILYKRAITTHARELLSNVFFHTDAHFQLALDKDQVHFIATQEELGRGSNSITWKSTSLFQQESLVFKEAQNKFCVESITASFQQLKELNPTGQVIGVQMPHSRVVQLCQKQTPPRCGFLAARYLGNMSHFSFSSREALRNVFFQLTSGLCHIHNLNYFHGDIKPSNCLYTSSRFDLADLDEIMNMKRVTEKLQEHLKKPSIFTEIAIWGDYSEPYVHSEDRALLKKIISDFYYKKISLKQTQKDIWMLMKARDIYALGETFKNLIQNNRLPQIKTHPGATIEAKHTLLSYEDPFFLNLKNLNIDDVVIEKILEALRLMTNSNFDSRFKGLEQLKEIAIMPFSA